MTVNNTTDRLHHFQHQLPAGTAALLSDPADIRYFSGFRFLVPAEREGLLVITKESTFLIQASFSPSINQSEITVLMGSHSSQLDSHFKTILRSSNFKTLWVDKTKLFADEYEAIQKISGLKLEPLNRQLIWHQRMIKDEDEVALIEQASSIAMQAFAKLAPKIKTGVTELELQRYLDLYMFELGAEQPAFPTIVAFGPHSALPHHQPTATALTPNSAALFDFGAQYQGYRSDITRTLWFGSKPKAEFTHIGQVVHQAYDAVIEQLRTFPKKPLKARDIDQTARTHISKQGFADNFIHTTGHGLGLDIHEQPSLYLRNETKLQPGMVITVEPGIYLNGQFGYRYENTVVLTPSGYRTLTLEKK